MKIVWMASLVAAAMSGAAWAQATIYKHVDESGRVTYTNKPMKGAVAMELDPLTTIPATPMGSLAPTAATTPAAPVKAVATLERVDKPLQVVQPTLASIEPQVQKRRDNDRRRILEEELSREEQSLTDVRTSITQEQQNPTLIAAVRTMQQTAEPSASQLVEMRNNIEKASGRIRGLQATVAEHEKNIEALKKELGALKP
jgi:predicted  nucleic acid-binding Zn-ribbon protein